MASQNDVLTEMAMKSLARYLSTTLTGYTGVWLASPDFATDQRPDPLDPNQKVRRQPPYVAIVYDEEATWPYEIGNTKVSRTIDVELWVVCEDHVAMLRRPQQVSQAIQTAADGLDELHESIPLLDFSQVGEPVVGRVEVRPGTRVVPWVEEFRPGTPLEKKDYKRLENAAIVICQFQAEKDRGAALL